MREQTSSKSVRSALAQCKSAFFAVALMSGLVNILYLTGSFFMLEVYDRVIPSRSVPTLIGLGVLAASLYAFQGLLDMLRSRILSRIGMVVDGSLSGRVFDIIVRAPLKAPMSGDALLPLRDLDQIRSALSGAGLTAIFDLPWMPIYLVICFLFHPLIGVAAIIGAIVLLSMTFATDRANRKPAKAVTACGVSRNSLADAGRRNAEVLAALGMQQAFARRWDMANRDYMVAQQAAADVAGGFGTMSKVFRTALQSCVLALGAWLVINNQATSGIMIASSIVVSRALAPAESAIANWKALVQARQAWGRLNELLDRYPSDVRRHGLPRPGVSLAAEGLSVCPPGTGRLAVQDISFTLKAGQGLGIIGPSASGKSSLVHALVGVWSPTRGKVRLDGAALDQWSSAQLGSNIGFLRQDVELFAGTIAENIARFEAEPSSPTVIAAAQAAGVHELILRLPDGYDTRIGDNGLGLSAGQKQRIGLARALYKDPFLVVLDEPNSNLDSEGETALTQAIMAVRDRGGICVVVAHRPSAIAALDTILILGEGRAQTYGPKDEVLKRALRAAPLGPAAPQPARPAEAYDAPTNATNVKEKA